MTGLPRVAYLDTNVALWVAQGKVSWFGKSVQRILDESGNRCEILVSPMVLIELEYLYEIGRSKLTSKEVQLKIEHELATNVCNLPFSDIAQVMIGEKWTRDPFDRMIVAHAKAKGYAALISADVTVQSHYSRTIW